MVCGLRVFAAPRHMIIEVNGEKTMAAPSAKFPAPSSPDTEHELEKGQVLLLKSLVYSIIERNLLAPEARALPMEHAYGSG